MLALREHPRDRDLRRRGADALGDGLHARDDRLVLGEGLGLEPRIPRAEVGRVEGGVTGQASRQEAPPERCERDERDVVLGAPRHHVVERAARPERELGLHRVDRVDRERALEGRHVDLGEPERAHLALGRELGHRADALLDRDVLVDPVQVVQVDDVDAESPQRCLAGLADVLGPAVAADLARCVVLDDQAGLGGDLDLVAAPGEGPADELLVRERAVDVRGVEEA